MAHLGVGLSAEGSIRPTRFVGALDVESARRKLALAQMSARLTRARRKFHRLTGLTAVTSLRSSGRDLGEPESLSPPVHPKCAELLRTVADAPCDEQWHAHIRASQRSPRSHSHTCPLGLRCSCIPIFLGRSLVGVAKLVADSGTSSSDFSAATSTLELAVSLSCHESYVSVLRGELQAVSQHVRRPSQEDPVGVATAEDGAAFTSDSIVGRALDYLHRHHPEPDMSLRSVAAAVGCNGKYLTQLFTQVVGQRMHGYIVALRVARASRELLETDRPIKQIAIESGFGDTGHLVRAFHRHVGVTPSVYRRIFAGH